MHTAMLAATPKKENEDVDQRGGKPKACQV